MMITKTFAELICNLGKKLPFGAFNVYYQAYVFEERLNLGTLDYPKNALMSLRRLHKWSNSEVFFF